MVHEIVGRINGHYGTLTHVPIHHLDRQLAFHELCALYAVTDIALVTSLRDGMNLVSYEYVACQSDNAGVLAISSLVFPCPTIVTYRHLWILQLSSVLCIRLPMLRIVCCSWHGRIRSTCLKQILAKEPPTPEGVSERCCYGAGVLVLSEFAGAAQSLGAGAILVNPWNITDMAAAIEDALTMSDQVRQGDAACSRKDPYSLLWEGVASVSLVDVCDSCGMHVQWHSSLPV